MLAQVRHDIARLRGALVGIQDTFVWQAVAEMDGIRAAVRQEWADVAGRVHLVVTGVYPFIGLAAVAVVIGTAIAICFGIYIALKWRFFT